MRHVTRFVFWGSLALTLASVGLTLAFGDAVLPVLVLSVAANLVALYRNERGGFVRSRELRRAYEPARHFNAAEVVTLFLAVLAQFTIGAYVLIS